MPPKKTSQNTQGHHDRSLNVTPFLNAEELWFWFITAQEARTEGARFSAGQGLYNRPCEPLDVLKILDRLYRQRQLLRDHLLVLRHYGRRHLPPDPYRKKEARAYRIWSEALQRMTPVLEKKGIIQTHPEAQQDWHQEMRLYEAGHMDLQTKTVMNTGVAAE